MIIGPVLKRSDGYGFDVWIAATGVSTGCSYRRIEDAYYDRRITARGSCQPASSTAVICETVDAFQVEVARFRSAAFVTRCRS